MKKNVLFTLWGVLFVLCAGLGFLPDANGGTLGASLLFFLPPALLLHGADKGKDRHTLLLVRNLSVLSLGVTLVTLILNFVLAVSSETLGTILHYILTIVSAPMICSGYWVVSLFLWACLLMASLRLLRRQ